jgi:long-chain acyl-CoA synthetase
MDGKEVRVFDPDDGDLGLMLVGEVVVRSETLMIGYLNKPKETAEALRNGWLHTGDLGYFDNDGFLYLIDRMKQIILRGGENISPREIEETLYGHPAVLETAVVGVPDLEYGEQVMAFVTLRDGLDASADELQELCAQRLARFKRPKEIIFLPEIPKTRNGKIDKPTLLRSFVNS